MHFESLVVSCEHASNRIPPAYRSLFRGAAAELRGHRGWDIGAAAVAEAMARRLGAPLFAGKASRLLIDLNRSLHHPRVFSSWTRSLSAQQRSAVVDRHYHAYRKAVENQIRALLADGGSVLHVSVHSFTPVWNGVARNADIGLLYDPRRAGERRLCAQWKEALVGGDSRLRVRRNYPYRGTSDGFSVALRRAFDSSCYACVELEINQTALRAASAARPMRRAIIESLERILRR